MRTTSSNDRRRWIVLFFLLVAALALALGACRQKAGESCQTTSDCNKGLICCYDGLGASSSLGTCLEQSVCLPIDAGLDASVSSDASP